MFAVDNLRAMKKVAIIGANGYSGEELCALLGRHPHVQIVAVTSRQHAGKPVSEILPRLRGTPAFGSMSFTESTVAAVLASGAQFAFLALPHGLAAEFAAPLVQAGVRVIDLSADFRLRDANIFQEFYGEAHAAAHLLPDAVYGIPEIHRSPIAKSKLVASAGCYPTSILLPLVPLLKAGLIETSPITVSSLSGVSGAGRKADTALLFAECNESLKAYGLPKHRHLSEIEQELSTASGEKVVITFVPHLAPMNRGIHSTIFVRPKGSTSAKDVEACWEKAYAKETFVRVSHSLPDVKNVNGTNFCDLAVRYDERAGQLILLSALDNLVKGAAGQAVQNFNIMAHLSETEGLL